MTDRHLPAGLVLEPTKPPLARGAMARYDESRMGTGIRRVRIVIVARSWRAIDSTDRGAHGPDSGPGAQGTAG